MSPARSSVTPRGPDWTLAFSSDARPRRGFAAARLRAAGRCVRAAAAAVLLSPAAAAGQPAGAAELPPAIPLFPLQDVVLFPDTSRPLHVFEPRYRAMVADAVRGDGLIGMVLLRPGHEAEYEGNPPIFPIGCAGEIAEAEELDDGRWLIVLRGVVRFRVLGEDWSRPYRVADVEAVAERLDEDGRTALRGYRPRLEAVLASAAPGAEAPPADWSDPELVNGLAQFLDLEPLDRQALLEAAGPLARAEALLELVGEPAGQEDRR